MKKVAVLGGGISGLSLSYFLKGLLPKDVNVTLIESSNRVGGWIRTINDKFLFERGPRGFRPSRNGGETLALVEELGLINEVVTNDKKAANRFLYYNGKVEKLPTNIYELLRSPFLKLLVPGLLHDLIASKGKKEIDESIYKFICRRFSKEIAENFIDPIASGIFAGDIRRLSVNSCFPIMKSMESDQRSLIKAAILSSFNSNTSDMLLDGRTKSTFVKNGEKQLSISFRNGLEVLTKALHDQFLQQNGNVRMDSFVEKVTYDSHRSTAQIQIKGNRDIIDADHVFSTLSASSLANMMPTTASNTIKKLQSIESTSVGVVNLGYKESLKFQPGFGYLIPSIAKQKALGVVYDSVAFPQQNKNLQETRLTVMIRDNTPNNTENELVDIALKTLKDHLKLDRKPDEIVAGLAEKSIPQFHTGHEHLVNDIKNDFTTNFPHITMTGWNYGLIGVADCISHSKQLALDFYKKNFN